MAEERKHIDDVFTEALRDYTEVPPPQAWNALEAKLDQRGGRRRRLAWWWYVVVGIAVISTGFLYLNSREGDAVLARAENGRANSQATIASPEPGTATSGMLAAAPTSTEEAPATVTAPAILEETAPVATRATKENKVASAIAGKKGRVVNTQKQKDLATGDVTDKDETSAGKETPATSIPRTQITTQASVKGRETDTITQLPLAESTESIEDLLKHRTGVVMNIKVLPPVAINNSDEAPIAASARVDTFEAPQSENYAPAKEQDIIVAVDNTATPEILQTVAKGTTSNDIVNETIKNLSNETEQLLASRQDAIVPTGPVAVIEPAVIMEPQVNHGTSSFIGPMPDNSAVTAKDQTPELVTSEGALDSLHRTKYNVNAEVFLKTGFEKGFGDYTINKFVFAPAIQLNLSDRFSLVLQPTVKAGTINNSDLHDTRSYHQITQSVVDSYKLYTTWSNAQGMIYDSVKAQYYYRQNYDSITETRSMQTKTLYEMELPLLLKYKFNRYLSLYAGPTLNYSKIAVIDTKQTVEGKVRIDTLTYHATKASAEKLSGPDISEVFKYNTNEYPISPLQTAPTISKMRLGMMLGASVDINNKLTVDLLMQQNLSRMNYIPNSHVKSIYLQPYFRFMLGYKVFGSKNDNKIKK